MRKNTKLSVYLAMVMLLCMLFTVCAPAAQAADDGEYPVVTWYLMSADQNVRDLELVEEAANKILREKVGLEIKMYFLAGDNYREKMNVMMNAGEELDIMAGGAYTGTSFNTAYTTGALLPLDSLLEEYGQDILAKNDERVWDSVRRDGQIYAIPSQMPWAKENVITYRKDIVEKYGFDYESVKTIDDLEPYMETIKENEPNVFGYFGVPTTANVTARFTDAALVGKCSPVMNGLVVFDYETQKMASYLDQEDVQYVYKKVNEFYKNGYSPKDALARIDFATEYSGGNYAALAVTEEFTGGSKSTAITGYDCVEGLVNRCEITTDSMNLVCTYISNYTKQPENCMKLINAVWADPALLNLLAYGIEGVNYTVVDNSDPEWPSIEPKTGDEQRWAVFHNFWGPLWDQWDSPWNARTALASMQDANANSPVSQIIGFTFDQEPVKTRVAEVLAIQAEAQAVLNTGAMPDYDAYMQELKARYEAAGLNEIIAEAQRQYEEWLKVK